MRRLLTDAVLGQENLAFAHTPGTSHGNRGSGFRPAFRDNETGQVALSRFTDGRLAPVHLLEGLPANWVAARDESGGVTAIKRSVIAGFVRDGRFYTRSQAAEAALQDSGDGCDTAWRVDVLVPV